MMRFWHADDVFQRALTLPGLYTRDKFGFRVAALRLATFLAIFYRTEAFSHALVHLLKTSLHPARNRSP